MKYARLIVTRTESTELYVEVPDDFDINQMIRNEHAKEVARIAAETTDSFDWDKSEWEDTVEVQSVKEVKEAEAKQYLMGTWRQS